MNWLFAAAAVAMAAGCAWIFFSDDAGIITRWLMAVGAVFFFYCAFFIARRANTRRPVSLDAKGLWIDGPTSRKVVAWDTIESVSRLSISSQEFNVLALKDPQQLIAQYDEAEAKAAVSQENIVGMFAAAVGAPSGGGPDLAAMFAKRRKQFGGEIYLSMHDRDRNAKDFETLINAWWKKHRKDTP